jgi:hypothetical protein
MKVLLLFLGLLSCNGLTSQTLTRLWDTDTVFWGPESVVYDQARDVLYVSNMRKSDKMDCFYGKEFISKVSLSGEILNLKWIEGLTEPTGICLHNDHLYIVERFGVVEYDLSSEKVVHRYRIRTDRFINDISVAPDGTVYVSESDSDKLYRIRGKEAGVWYQGEAVSHTNGILFDRGHLVAGVIGDSALKSIDPETMEITTIAQCKKGVFDGIKLIGEDYLVSFYEGILFRVTRTGEITELMNSRNNFDIADFEYIENRKLLIVPAVKQHKLIGFRLE